MDTPASVTAGRCARGTSETADSAASRATSSDTLVWTCSVIAVLEWPSTWLVSSRSRVVR